MWCVVSLCRVWTTVGVRQRRPSSGAAFLRFKGLGLTVLLRRWPAFYAPASLRRRSTVSPS